MKTKHLAALLAAGCLIGLSTGVAGPTVGASAGTTGSTGAAPAPTGNKSTTTTPAAPAAGAGILPGDDPNSPTKRPTIPVFQNPKGADTTTTPTPGQPANPANPNGITPAQPVVGVSQPVLTAPMLPGITPVNPSTVTVPGAVPGTSAPVINGSVFGTGGKVYFVSTDGMLFFRNADGSLHNFGRFLSSPATGSSPTPGLTATNVQQPFLPQPGSQTNAPAAPVSPVVPSTVAVAAPNGASAAGPNPAIGNSGRAVNITGTAVGTDGKTFYLASDGFLYFRGQDGMLHTFGSGASK